MSKIKHIDLIILLAIILLLVLIRKGEPADFVPDTPEKVEALVMAIYQAEGGTKTNFPFGIKSISCENYTECKRICRNTVQNNLKRWQKAVDEGYMFDYLTFLHHRYCPPKLNKLNLNWKKNVVYFLRKG